MADFCKQCSIDIFGEDLGDLKDLPNSKDLGENWGIPALCEGCGSTIVNKNGECIWDGCHKHKKNRNNK